MTDRSPDSAPAESGAPAPRRCADCYKPVRDGLRTTWTRQHGSRLLCPDCQKGY